MFGSPQVKHTIFNGHEERFEFPECIAHFRDGSERGTVLALTKPDRNRVERIAQDPEIGQEQDLIRDLIDAILSEKSLCIFSSAAINEPEVISILETVKSGRIHAKKRDFFWKRFQFLEVNGKQENPVEEFVLFW